ncbi:MAG: winged helix-turn-helix domain-containing protein [Candidatus Aenigmatarchaeota archaeon]
MEICGKEIKALASDTRVMILKSLGGRRKMPSELSREFSMAPSTIVEHLHVLERSGLIKKIETGHKWKYYELTEKGRNLVRPKFPVRFAVMLSVGLLLVFGSFASLLTAGAAPINRLAAETTKDYAAGAPAPFASVPEAFSFTLQHYAFAAIIVGIVLIIYASVKLWSKWR